MKDDSSSTLRVISLLKIIVGSGLLVLAFLAIGIAVVSNDSISMGDYGSYIGGVLGTGVSFVTVVLVYQTYKLQERELLLARQELQETRAQMQNQQFETTFFKMLDLLKHQVSEISIVGPNRRGLDSASNPAVYHRGLAAFSYVKSVLLDCGDLKSPAYKKLVVKSLSFEVDDIRLDRTERDEGVLMHGLVDWVDESILNREKYLMALWAELSELFEYELDAFFNTIQFILEQIQLLSNAKFYIGVLKSQLNNDQLIVMFYSCLSKKKFKSLIDDAGLLAKISDLSLISSLDVFLYPKTDFEDSIYKGTMGTN